MSLTRSLIAETNNGLLERALVEKLHRRGEAAGSLGELEPVAVRLGLLQNTLKPRFRDPQLVVFAADHGLVVDGIHASQRRQTDEQVLQLLNGQLPVAAFARLQGMALTVVDCGMARQLPAHERLLQRKIAHGTRNARVGNAMTLEQAHAAIRAGMEIGDTLHGNLVACAGLGVGSHESAALVLSRLTQSPIRDLIASGPQMNPDLLAHLMVIVQGALGRHRDVVDAVEVLAAFGGFETAVMVGVMLVAASKRHLVMVDGVTACAALLVASRISASVTDYCVFCRSQNHRGLDQALSLFQATALLELGLDTVDGTGACLSWPLVRAAAALLTDLGDGEEAGPSRPAGVGPAVIQNLFDPEAPTQPGASA
jgi:nicotinate-nucleotide--dimethylbenzimidazole phosphoribosyltransferase